MDNSDVSFFSAITFVTHDMGLCMSFIYDNKKDKCRVRKYFQKENDPDAITQKNQATEQMLGKIVEEQNRD